MKITKVWTAYNLDAAFVVYENQDDEPTRRYLGSGSISSVMASSSLTVGMSVSKYGNESYYQTGTITSKSCSKRVLCIDNKERVFVDQIELDIKQCRGDSGAPLVCGDLIDNSIIGIVVAATFANTSSTYGNPAYATKSENIHSKFGLNAYLVA